jgi:hypothetical protein
MRKLKFPTIDGKKGKTDFPDKSICPVCKKNKVFEPHSFAVLDGGALLMNRKKDEGGPSPNMDGFLNFIWHGAHDGDIGIDSEVDALLPIADEVRGGQFDFYFCSTNCLRTFLNKCVDELENRIEKQKGK